MTKGSLAFPIFLSLLSCQSSPVRAPSSAAETEDQSAPFYQLDPKFESFEGGSFESEKAIYDQLIGYSKQMMTKMYADANKTKPGYPMTRDAHAKSHGCLKANFDVDPAALPEVNRVGLFAAPHSYQAWMRYSNNDQLPMRKDGGFDIRGVSIKVLDVPGPKIMPGYETAMTQDFLMFGSPIFFIANNADYIGFIKGLRDGNAATVLLTQQPVAAEKTLRAQYAMRNYTNPLNMTLFSAVPIRLGLPSDPNRRAMKYRVIPCDQEHPQPSPVAKDQDNYMRLNLKASLSQAPACLYFQVQLQTDSEAMPIENSTVRWRETPGEIRSVPYSPYVTVARIEIPQQNFDTPERDKYCENLSLTPWHALVEHKPLGRTMRMRRDFYKATSTYRRTTNGASMVEPTGYEIP